jgi:hypothetical protein
MENKILLLLIYNKNNPANMMCVGPYIVVKIDERRTN